MNEFLHHEERRDGLRYPCDLPLVAQGVSLVSVLGFTRCNISARGIGLLVRSAAAPPTIAIDVPRLTAGMTVHVRHITPSMGTWYLLGGTFAASLDDEAFLADCFLPAAPIVLMVEGDASVRLALDVCLRARGFSIWSVSSGNEAIAVLRRHHPRIGLALVDAGFTGREGLQTIAALKGIAPRLPCWLMTGDADRYDAAEVGGLGVQRILRKPFAIDECVDLLRIVLG